MSFTYDPTQIAASGTGNELSAVRFILQDTTQPAFFEDSEIIALFDSSSTAYSNQESRVYYTCLELAKALHRRFARQATFSSAGTSVQLNERAQYWLTIVQDLAVKLATLSYTNSLFAVVGRNPSYSDDCGITQSYTIDRW